MNYDCILYVSVVLKMSKKIKRDLAAENNDQIRLVGLHFFDAFLSVSGSFREISVRKVLHDKLAERVIVFYNQNAGSFCRGGRSLCRQVFCRLFLFFFAGWRCGLLYGLLLPAAEMLASDGECQFESGACILCAFKRNFPFMLFYQLICK